MVSQEYLTELPPQLGLLQNLRQLKLGGTRLSSPPAELIAQGTTAVMRFLRDGVEVRPQSPLPLQLRECNLFRAFNQGMERRRTAMAMLLGDAGGGKTTLWLSLNSSSPCADTPLASTDGTWFL